MGLYGIYLLFILGIALFIYYIYIIVVGKSLARLVGSKDRYIWNGLLNISAPGMPFAKKRNTLFLDHDNLVISHRNVVNILHELRRTESLEEAIVIPFQRIVAFDYKRSVDDWNVVVRFLLTLWNRLIKKNDYHLSVRYLDGDRSIKQFLFKASSMDANDFEATFADFDNQIYSGKVRYEAEHGNLDDMIAQAPQPVPPVVNNDNPTVFLPRETAPVVVPVNELNPTEELPRFVNEEPVVSDEPEVLIVSDETPVEALPFVAAAEAQEIPDEIVTEAPVNRPSRKWFEEEYLPRRKEKSPVTEADANQTVMIDRQELRDRGIVFEKPTRRQSEDVVYDRPPRKPKIEE